jgi:organic radical activating enzyme
MHSIAELHKLLPDTPGKNFCIAPFQSIRQNAYGRNSPCAFGAGEWEHQHLSPKQRWDSAELNQLRYQFIQDQRPSECHRCWKEEDAGKTSLRQRQYLYFPNDYQDFIKSGQWVHGPKTAVFKTSNVCNLACRTCGSWDSNTFGDEGSYYSTTYQTKNKDGEPYNRYMLVRPARHMNFMQYSEIAQNLEKIDFFGGEPFLNITQLDLLEHLVKTGVSKNITLFYSTNCTNHPTDRLKRAWNQFKKIEISVSIDGVGDKFEYMRWPGKWDKCQDVLAHIQSLKNTLDCDVYLMSGLTVSLLNAFDIDNVYSWLKENVGDVYINMVNSPDFLSLHIAPDSVKSAIRAHVKNPEVLGYMDIHKHNPLLWKQFLIWTKRLDIYRKQNYVTTYSEFYPFIKEFWDQLLDLSETNFNSL